MNLCLCYANFACFNLDIYPKFQCISVYQYTHNNTYAGLEISARKKSVRVCTSDKECSTFKNFVCPSVLNPRLHGPIFLWMKMLKLRCPPKKIFFILSENLRALIECSKRANYSNSSVDHNKKIQSYEQNSNNTSAC